MRILITTFGTRGDVQPYIALGQGLRQAGHTAALCTSEGYQALVEAHGLEYLFMDNETLRLSQALLGETKGVSEPLRLAQQMPKAMRRTMDDEWAAARAFQPDLIVYHPKCLGSVHVAEKLGRPAMLAIPLPVYTPTRAFPMPFMANVRLGGGFNRFSYWLIGLSSGMFAGLVRDYRVKTLGLPARGAAPSALTHADGRPVPILYAYSPHVLPVPADFPPHVHVTGYWFLDRAAGWQPEPGLVQFLEAGPPPVYVGFGSMGGRGGQERAAVVLEALAQAGQRGVLTSGWGGLRAADLPREVYMVESVPHDWLFPQVAAVVHHGGAGTTAAGLRAGKPSVICPFIADQPFWGGLVAQLGAGPQPIPQGRLTAKRLADAIAQAVEGETMRAQAAALGEQIRAEDGVARAVELIAAEVRQADPTAA